MSKRLATILTLLGVAAVLVLVAPPATAQDRALAAPENYFTQGPVTGPLCIYGFSKDFCQGKLGGGQWEIYQKPQCPDRGALQGLGATLSGYAASSGGICVGPNGLDGLCDEAEELSGFITAQVDVNSMLNNACPGRGSWGGKFGLNNDIGLLLAQGRIDGTLAVGTHRKDQCPDGPCTPVCEDCYTNGYNPFTGMWELHTEGFLEARVVAGTFAGCRIRSAVAGRFDARGDRNGPYAPNPNNWDACLHFDGVVECPCF